MTDEEEKELRAQVAALKAENDKYKAKAEDDSDDDDSDKEDDAEGAGDDEPHSEADEEDEKKDKAAAQAAEVAAFVARGFITPKDKGDALKMKPGAWSKYRDTLLKMGPVVPTSQIKPPQGKMRLPGESDDNAPAAATETEKAYMKATGKSLEEVRALAKVPKSQAHTVVMSLATRKAV